MLTIVTLEGEEKQQHIFLHFVVLLEFSNMNTDNTGNQKNNNNER